MMKKMIRKNTLLFICALTLWILGFSGCSNEREFVKNEVEQEIISVPVVFRFDPATNISENEQFIRDYNAAFKNRYQMEVEWLSTDAAGYRNKLKQWNVLDEMPVLIADAGFDNDFYRVLVKDKRLVDLRPYMEKSDFWMDVMRKDILAQCVEEDGSIYLSPLSASIDTYAGIIYNEELLALAGYESFPDTWSGFFECLEKLNQMDITPLALHGSGSYWVPMLMATAYLSKTEEGLAFLNEEYPSSYQNEEMKEMFLMMKELYGYTFEDALDLDYDQTAQRFLKGEAAIIANGQWMIGAMDDNEKEIFRYAPFPEKVMMNSPRMGAWAVTAGHSEEVTQAAVDALEFRIQCERKSIEKYSDIDNLSPVARSYYEIISEIDTIMPNYQMQWEQEIQNDFFTENLPDFLSGKIDVETFLKMMDIRVDIIQGRK